MRPRPMRTVSAHQGWVRSIAVSPDGSQAATCGNDHKVKLWSLADGKAQMDLPGHSRPVYRVAYTTDGKSLVSADLMGLIIQWDMREPARKRGGWTPRSCIFTRRARPDHGGVRDFSISARRGVSGV